MFYNRKNNLRKKWLKFGLGISSLYLLFTIINKIYIDTVFKSSLKDEGIAFQRFSAQPSIFNNILWYGIAETETNYQVAFYSLLDKSNRFSEWQTIPKKRLDSDMFSNDISCLSWFSDHYYNIEATQDGEYLYNDLRYPLVETRNGYKSVFNLNLFETNGRLDMRPFEPEMEDFEFTMTSLWERIKGK